MKETYTGADIHPTYGVPRECISCPGCGELYTRRRTCTNCDECVKCCSGRGACTNQSLISGADMAERAAQEC